MANSSLASYNYETGAQGSLHWRGYRTFISVVLIGILTFATFPYSLAGIILIIVLVVSASGKNKAITIGSDFIILGDTVLWYANINSIKIDTSEQQIILIGIDDERHIIESSNFIPETKKSFKIPAKQKKMFDKTVVKLQSKLSTWEHINIITQ